MPELYNIAQDPSEKNDVAAQSPEKVAALQRRVNELAAAMAQSLLLRIEFEALRKRLAMPPALPGEEFLLSEEPEAKPSPPASKVQGRGGQSSHRWPQSRPEAQGVG